MAEAARWAVVRRARGRPAGRERSKQRPYESPPVMPEMAGLAKTRYRMDGQGRRRQAAAPPLLSQGTTKTVAIMPASSVAESGSG